VVHTFNIYVVLDTVTIKYNMYFDKAVCTVVRCDQTGRNGLLINNTLLRHSIGAIMIIAKNYVYQTGRNGLSINSTLLRHSIGAIMTVGKNYDFH
jgi:hypothetical protein